jgi:hypothetical protein
MGSQPLAVALPALFSGHCALPPLDGWSARAAERKALSMPLTTPRIIFVEKVGGAIATAAGFMFAGNYSAHGTIAAAIIGAASIVFLGVSSYFHERNDERRWLDPLC